MNTAETLHALIEIAPDVVRHLFACDCAARAFAYARREGFDVGETRLNAVETKRRWIRGEATDDEIAEADFAAIYHDVPRTMPGIVFSFDRCAMWATEPRSSNHSAKKTAYNARDVASNCGVKDEVSWQCRRLLYLSEAYIFAGDRLPFLLQEGKIATPPDVAIDFGIGAISRT